MYEYMRGLQRQFFKEPDFPELRQELHELYREMTGDRPKEERRKLSHPVFFFLGEGVGRLCIQFRNDPPGQTEACRKAGEGYLIPQLRFQVY